MRLRPVSGYGPLTAPRPSQRGEWLVTHGGLPGRQASTSLCKGHRDFRAFSKLDPPGTQLFVLKVSLCDPGLRNLLEAHLLGNGNEIGHPLDIRQKSGPDSVYLFGSVKLTSEAAYLNRKLAALWVTNNSDYQARICHFIAGAAIAGLSRHGAGAIGPKHAARPFAGIHRSRIAGQPQRFP
jgi:hypothetical protein